MSRSTLMLLITVFMITSLPATASTYSVVVSGLGGTPEYTEAFEASSGSFAQALRSLDNDELLTVQLDESATRVQILQAIEQMAGRIQTDINDASVQGQVIEPTFVLILTGHGNADSAGWRFNVAGPDLTTDDLVAALNVLPTSRQLLVLGASASGAALDTLSQLGRVLVTATKSGGEINAVRFHTYLAEAFQDDVADYNRNEILTIAEAFRFADARTREYYEQQNLLASEHARIRGEQSDEMAVALLGSLQNAKDDPAVAQLLDERLVLENAFKSLTERKPDMPVEDYYSELEELLLSIAELQQTIDIATGWSDSDANN